MSLHSPGHSPGLSPDHLASLLPHWQEGVDEFARGRYWQVHECWERGWTSLPVLLRRHIQSQIQGASVFHLLERGRFDAARRLARRALFWRSEVSSGGGLSPQTVRPEIDGLFEWLESWLAAGPELNEQDVSEWVARAKTQLAARVVGAVPKGP